MDDWEPMEISDSDDDESLDASSSKDVTYKVISIDEVTHKMEQIIEGVVSSTEMPAPVARIALSLHNWDRWVLLEKFYDDQDKFFEKINVMNPLQEVASTSRASTSKNFAPKAREPTRECLTCYEESNDLVGLSCNHMFCKDCWSMYLAVKINEGSELISCQNLKCDIVVDDPTVNGLLTDDKLKARYKRWITNSFVLSDQFLEWCPGADCNNAIEASNTPIHRLNCTCDCGHEFCFECKANHHEPMPCYLYTIWQNQSADATLRYMMKNTKPCPKCDCLIEKNMGCDYMYCTRCRTEFCWVCFKKCFNDWRYGHGMCNTPKDERPPINHNAIRYQRYNSKYEAHKQSFDAEKKTIQIQIDRALAKSVRGGLMQGDIKMLEKSFGIVLACRKSLMMSYIFAYFVIEGNQKTIFEQNQCDLEEAVRILSAYLLADETYDQFADSNVKIKGKTEYCEHRRTMLHDHISEGLDKRWWSFYKD